jgi:hypothetical protein
VSPTFSVGRYAALGLEADVDDREILFDGHDATLDDRSLGKVLTAHARIEEGFEIVPRGVHAHIVGHGRIFGLLIGSGPCANAQHGRGEKKVF